MPRLRNLTGQQVMAALEKCGFSLDRVEGSHHILKKPGHRYLLSVPVHSRKILKPGTLRRIIRDAGLSMVHSPSSDKV
jgi:predicted RNA binding protein YcfA (HicA-like mRNA interferase family)